MAIDRVDEVGLNRTAGRETSIERTFVAVSTAAHFNHEILMTLVKRREFAAPTLSFRMACISAFFFGNDRPECVKLSMLTEQMLPAQAIHGNIPDTHVRALQSSLRCGRGRDDQRLKVAWVDGQPLDAVSADNDGV